MYVYFSTYCVHNSAAMYTVYIYIYKQLYIWKIAVESAQLEDI